MNQLPRPESDHDPQVTPEDQAALDLLCGGSLDDFYQTLSDAATARSLVAFLKAHPDLVRPAEDV